MPEVGDTGIGHVEKSISHASMAALTGKV